MTTPVDWDEYSWSLSRAEELPPAGAVEVEGTYDPDCVACQGDHHFWCPYCKEIVGHGHLHAELPEGGS